MTSNTQQKLHPHTTWLFAFGSIAAAIGATYAASGLGQKACAAIYFAIVAAGGFLATYLTRARVRLAVGAFLVAGAVAGAAYFELVNVIFKTATVVMSDAVSGGQAHAQGVEAGNFMGHFFGVFVAICVFLETIVAGIGGAVAGDKSRGEGGLAALGAFAKSAR
ncbi:MAG TPA: hypothetical protein VGM88_15940 [Kofleriaceae bacterium]|jgi:hypothetical protein